MARRTTRWTLYSKTKEYMGSLVHLADAIVLIARHGDGTQVRGPRHRRVLWEEGSECCRANDVDVDHVVDVINKRWRQNDDNE